MRWAPVKISSTPKKKDALVTNTALSFSDAMLISCAAPEKNPLQLILASTGGGRAPMSKIQLAMYRWTYAVENGAAEGAAQRAADAIGEIGDTIEFEPQVAELGAEAVGKAVIGHCFDPRRGRPP